MYTGKQYTGPHKSHRFFVKQSKMNWPEWMRHYSSRAGSKTLTALEGMGGTAAYYLGIIFRKSRV